MQKAQKHPSFPLSKLISGGFTTRHTHSSWSSHTPVLLYHPAVLSHSVGLGLNVAQCLTSGLTWGLIHPPQLYVGYSPLLPPCI